MNFHCSFNSWTTSSSTKSYLHGTKAVPKDLQMSTRRLEDTVFLKLLHDPVSTLDEHAPQSRPLRRELAGRSTPPRRSTDPTHENIQGFPQTPGRSSDIRNISEISTLNVLNKHGSQSRSPRRGIAGRSTPQGARQHSNTHTRFSSNSWTIQ